MGNVYTSQAIADYNLNPPSDDGSSTPSNRLNWSKHKTKLSDPVKTLAEAINTQLSTAFGKVQGGITSVAVDYTVQSSDQGRLIVQTGADKTITTPAAATVESPFRFHVLNAHATADLTLDGNASETIDGSATITIPAGRGVVVETDGSNWYTSGRNWIDDAKGSDIASAGPLVIPAYGDYFDVTGTTGFSAMTVGADRIFTLQFDAALVMTHGASLVLPGAANITTAAGDAFTFMATAANTVVCIAYVLASGRAVVEDGDYVFIGTIDAASANATFDFGANATPAITLDTSLYDAFEFVIQNLIPDTDAVEFQARTSANGGTTYESAAGNYGWVLGGRSSGASPDSDNVSDTELVLSGTGRNVGSAANEHGISGKVRMIGAHQAGVRTPFTWELFWIDDSGAFNIVSGGGQRNAAEANDGVRFLFSSGAPESGTISVYGLKNS